MLAAPLHARAPPRVSCPARCLAEVRLPGFECDEFRLALLEQADTGDAAQLLVECFLPLAAVDPKQTAASAAAAAAVPTPPSMPRDDLGLPLSPPLPPLGPAALARWKVSHKGLHWRVGSRLERPTLDRSLESSLVLAVQAVATEQMIACVELSLRPADGSLPGEFAPPPLLLRHRKAPLNAYVSNLAVHTDYRRRRLGSRLLGACEDVAAQRWGCRELYLHVAEDNAAGLRMYEARGYVPLPALDKKPPSPSALVNLYHRKALPPRRRADAGVVSTEAGAEAGAEAEAVPAVEGDFSLISEDESEDEDEGGDEGEEGEEVVEELSLDISVEEMLAEAAM